jgi:glucosamine kinase
VDDEGSGGWLGLQAVRHGLAAFDGRAHAGALARRVWMHCGDERESLLAWCQTAGQFEFAQLARAVFECEASDPVAAGLLQRATVALEELALAVDPRGRLPVAVAGSVGERLAPRMRPFVRGRLVTAREGAAAGALMLARRALAQTEEAL